MKWAKIGRKTPISYPLLLLRWKGRSGKLLSMKAIQKMQKLEPFLPSGKKEAVFCN